MPKQGPEGGLAQADRSLAADPVQSVAQADRGSGLALAGRGRIDGCDEDQLAVRPVLQALDVAEVQLGDVVAEGRVEAPGMPSLSAISWIGTQARLAGDFDVAFHGCPQTSFRRTLRRSDRSCPTIGAD
jgi:hypothetical protein